ncbi:MAG: NAD(P)H-binding protein [Alphaproteobacteria bacterium]|nr:NAD(P)H-binding protein [Alphaproteobacteria bacterium]
MMKSVVALTLSLLFWAPMSLAAGGGVLVLGGTGQLGSEIAKDLVGAGKTVTVLARPTSSRARLEGLDVTYVIGDMLVDADMERIFTSTPYDAVVDASSQAFGGDQAFYEESQVLVSKWAAATKVGQVILHGAIGAADSDRLIYVEKTHPVQQTAIASKTIAEAILTSSGVPYTIIRHLTLLSMETKESGNARLTEDLTAVGAMTRDGLARLTLECLGNEDCLNVIFHAVDDDVALTERTVSNWETVIKPEYRVDRSTLNIVE